MNDNLHPLFQRILKGVTIPSKNVTNNNNDKSNKKEKKNLDKKTK